jgi:hypothetical protein
MRIGAALLLTVVMAAASPAQSRGADDRSADGRQSRDPSYRGLRAGMLVEDLVQRLELPKSWKKWCSHATMAPPADSICHVQSEWIGSRASGTTFAFTLDDSATVSKAIIVHDVFDSRAKAQREVQALDAEWQPLLAFEQLGYGVCGYNLSFHSYSYVASVRVDCRDRRGERVSPDFSRRVKSRSSKP